MSTGTTAEAGTAAAPATVASAADPVGTRPARRSMVSTTPETAADRFMRRLLRVRLTDRNLDAAAHRRMRLALFVSAIRCIVTYVLIPVLVPLLSIAGVLAAPVGIALCAVAVVSGVAALRRFWSTNHKGRWMYTAFIAVVFAILAVGLVADISHLAGAV